MDPSHPSSASPSTSNSPPRRQSAAMNANSTAETDPGTDLETGHPRPTKRQKAAYSGDDGLKGFEQEEGDRQRMGKKAIGNEVSESIKGRWLGFERRKLMGVCYIAGE